MKRTTLNDAKTVMAWLPSEVVIAIRSSDKPEAHLTIVVQPDSEIFYIDGVEVAQREIST